MQMKCSEQRNRPAKSTPHKTMNRKQHVLSALCNAPYHQRAPHARTLECDTCDTVFDTWCHNSQKTIQVPDVTY